MHEPHLRLAEMRRKNQVVDRGEARPSVSAALACVATASVMNKTMALA